MIIRVKRMRIQSFNCYIKEEKKIKESIESTCWGVALNDIFTNGYNVSIEFLSNREFRNANLIYLRYGML